jgi:hypothetical protein
MSYVGELQGTRHGAEAANTVACEAKSSEGVCCFVQTGLCYFHRGATCCGACRALALHVTSHVKVQPYLRVAHMSTSLLQLLDDEHAACI